MADPSERTEAPTPRRRQEARGKGQVPRSQDLALAVVLLAGLWGLSLIGPGLWSDLLVLMQFSLTASDETPVQAAAFTSQTFFNVFLRLSPFLIGLVVVAVVVLYGQVGWLVTTHPLKPDASRLNPLRGFARIFSGRNGVQLLMSTVKLLLIGGAAFLTVQGNLPAILFALSADPAVIFGMAVDLTYRLGINLALLLLLLALLDYAYQRYRHEKDLRMTKEEVREELRRMEGDPVMKRRRRDVHRQLALQKLRKDVPKADVVVTNPTHLAIAIHYQPDTMNAPKVVAKGADFMAQKIREIASASGIPIIEKPSLARVMYDHVEPGQYVPERFYRAIAEILAYVYEISGKKLALEAGA